MREDIYKIESVNGGVFYEVYKAVQDSFGVILRWQYVGETEYNFQALSYVQRNGRRFDPNCDRVSWLANML